MKKLHYFIKFSFLLLFFSSGLHAQSNEIFISETGNDANEGTIDSPLATIIGARDMARTTGAKTIWIRGGRYNFDATCTLGSADSGLSISGYNDELVIFDGSSFVDPQGFSDVAEPTLLAKLHTNASNPGTIKSTIITDDKLIALLSKSTAQISINDEMKTLARYPNLGYATFNNGTISTTGEVAFNKDNTHIGDYSNPKGGSFQLLETAPDFTKWSAEATRTQRVAARGYYTAVWLKETNRVLDVSAGDGRISLVDGSRYGLESNGANGKIRRVFVYNMLCELDEPGEWYFDAEDNRLYVWFENEVDTNTKIGVWAGPQLFDINSASDITIENLTVQNIGSGRNGDAAINIEGSSDNILVAGVRFRFISEPITALNIWHDVTNSKALSCDFYDVPNATRLYGGTNAPTKTSPPGNNAIENCHFTQIFSKDFYGKACGMNGKGNRFINNLVHNMNGQPITHRGFDHVFEKNEIFNVGIEEGDGGAIYTGNAVWSYGNVLRHNFVHHLMSVPSLLGRAAFFSDDIDGGENIIENVFYKAGWETIKTNNGAGHDVLRNVILESFIGIRSSTTTRNYDRSMAFISSNDATNGTKNNYIGRMLKAVGLPDWETGLTVDNWNTKIDPDWFAIYPKFEKVMQEYITNKQFGDNQCFYTGNMFFDSKSRDVVRGNESIVAESQAINLGIFQDVASLNFKFAEPRPEFAPNIPFQNIGLYLDGYRCAVPVKNTYRRNIQLRFNGQDAHNPGVRYDFNTINDRLYYNSGAMVYATVPCSATLPTPAEVAEDSLYEFDLGTPNSPIFKEYLRVSNITSEASYGWLDTTGLESEDRGAAAGVNALNRDFVTSSDPKTFEANVVDGTWSVVVTLGDRDVARDNMQIRAEGVVKATGIDRGIKEFKNESFDVTVADGKLTLEFSDEGGTDPNWAVTRIRAVKKEETLSTRYKETEADLIGLSPNPSVDFLNLNLTGKFIDSALDIQIIDNLGRTMWRQKGVSNGYNIPVDHLATGIYFLEMKVENKSIIKRFIKK